LPAFVHLLLPAALVAVAAAGCASPSGGGFGSGEEWTGGPTGGSSSGGAAGSSSGASTGGSSSGGTAGSSSGGSTSPDGGPWTPPPPSQPPQPGGYQQTIAPLLDASGCTECHHHGRPIDLTTYPFMAGSASDAAAQLVASLSKDMPPAPRTPAAQSVIDQVNAWVAAGMKP
jgi:hypothetical protein